MVAGPSPVAAGAPCHSVADDAGFAVAAPDTDCCATAVERTPALSAPIAVVDAGFALESPLGVAALVAPLLSVERGEDHAPRSRQPSTPLYTLHSSLLL